MRHVPLYVLAILVLATLSCKKDHSKEGDSMHESSWEFRASEKTFGGPVDSAFIESSGSEQRLTIYGSSDEAVDGRFRLSIISGALNEGPVVNAEANFHYEAGTDYLASEKLLITITRIDENTISGTFSATVMDSQGKTQNVEEGKFQCNYIRRTIAKKTLTVWTKEICGQSGSLQIRINDSSQFINTALTEQPSCKGSGSVSFSLDEGSHTVHVICGDTLTYEVEVDDDCTFLEVSLNNDYLPLGLNSSWDYADVDNENVTQTFTSGGEIALNGTTYTQLNRTGGDTYYFRKSGHAYVQYRELSFQDFVSNAPFVELVILKDDLPKGQTWETDALDVSISGVVKKIKMVSTIINRDYSEVIHGVTYNNLIKVNTELFFSPDNGNSFAASGSAYNTVFAKGKGIVKYNDMDVAIEWGIKSVSLNP